MENPSLPQKDKTKIDNPADAINATTAGRNPPKIPCITVKFLYLKYIHASKETMTQDGKTHPNVAMIAPPSPAIRVPTKVDELMAMGPGVIYAMVIKSVNSVRVSQ